MFKRVISILLATVLVVSMTGCSELTSVATSTSEPAVSTSVDKPADNTQTSTTASVSASVEETQTSASVSEPELAPEPEPQPEPEPEGYAKYISNPDAWDEMPKEEFEAINTSETVADLSSNPKYSDVAKNWIESTPEDVRVATYIKGAIERYESLTGTKWTPMKVTFEMVKTTGIDFKFPCLALAKRGDYEAAYKAHMFFVTGEDVLVYYHYKIQKMIGALPSDFEEPKQGTTIEEWINTLNAAFPNLKEPVAKDMIFCG